MPGALAQLPGGLPRCRQTFKLGVSLALATVFDAAILDPRRSTVITW